MKPNQIIIVKLEQELTCRKTSNQPTNQPTNQSMIPRSSLVATGLKT